MPPSKNGNGAHAVLLSLLQFARRRTVVRNVFRGPLCRSRAVVFPAVRRGETLGVMAEAVAGGQATAARARLARVMSTVVATAVAQARATYHTGDMGSRTIHSVTSSGVRPPEMA